MKITIGILLAMLVCMSGFAADWYPAEIELSDGKMLHGKLSLLGSRPLAILPEKTNYERKIPLNDIISITQRIESQSMERPWAYKEAGKVEKIYFEGSYPLINFTAEVLLSNGQVVRGHAISLPLKFSGDGPKKLFLNRQIKGSVGQTMTDLVYPVKITFPAAIKQPVPPITGTVTGYGKLQKVTALDNQREVVCFGEVKDNKFEFKNLLPGTYDIYIQTSSQVLAGLSPDGPENLKGEPLPKNALAELKKVFPLADDFFPDRWILELAGNTGFAKTLVYKRRADFYNADEHTHGGYVWHLDIWSWHLAGGEWKIDRRYIMLRHKQQGGEPLRELISFKQLAAVKPGTVITINAENKADGGKFIKKLD
ncbi:MAG: hypothetical protein WC071_01970 [Victivallaceae bacterium]